MQEIKEKFFEGEHALYGLSNAILENVTFGNGESPLKETKDLVIKNNIFKYKYPLWYSDNIQESGLYPCHSQAAQQDTVPEFFF